jgi:hypothetical protein
LNTIDKMLVFTDSVYKASTPEGFDTAKYISTLSHVIKERFYHGELDYSVSENWIAYLAGKTLWSHFSSIVIPADILKHSRGLCSQQTIIFMELIRRKGIDVRSVGLGYSEGPGHFLCEVRYGGVWHLHDVSIEPEWMRLVNDHRSLDYYLTVKDSLYKAYEPRISRTIYNKIMERTTYGEINVMPAKKMIFFHHSTAIASYLLPILFLTLGYRALRNKKKQALNQTPPVNAEGKEMMMDLSSKQI